MPRDQFSDNAMRDIQYLILDQYSLRRGCMDQIRAGVLHILFLKNILSKDFKKNTVFVSYLG